jgi:predicted short-subunit dehydrogenase-like oxidoreductase (DUF2520 family)
MRVAIVGRSKVGLTLAAALRERGHAVELHAARRPPRGPLDAELVVVATRDGHVTEVATALAESGAVSRKTAVVHVAGALGAEALAPLGDVTAGVGQAHPLLSFASADAPPVLEGALLLVSGDPVAVRRAKALARALGMRAGDWPGLDRALYHAAAALVANGAAALVDAGAELLAAAGAPPESVARALSALLRSVAENVARVGLPDALTGPVRRGDATTVRRHLDAVVAKAPAVAPLYVEGARAQLRMARAIDDASPGAFDALEKILDSAARRRQVRKK